MPIKITRVPDPAIEAAVQQIMQDDDAVLQQLEDEDDPKPPWDEPALPDTPAAPTALAMLNEWAKTPKSERVLTLVHKQSGRTYVVERFDPDTSRCTLCEYGSRHPFTTTFRERENEHYYGLLRE